MDDLEPMVDESVVLRCEDCGESWHPGIFPEYQGEYPHGGTVYFFEDDSHDCPSCGREGTEIKG